MLIELYGENFGCFRDRFVLSMLAADIDPDSDRGIVEVKIKGDPEPLRLLRAVALYGPNASGKSTIIRAAGALAYLVSTTHKLRSDSQLKWHEPFALGKRIKEEVTLGAKVVIEGVVYEYSVSYTREAILQERLVRWHLDEEEVLFERRKQKVSGKWSRNAQIKLITQDFRQNALLLSLADSLAPKLAGGIAVGLRHLLAVAPRTKAPARGMPATYHPNKTHSDLASRVSRDKPFREWLVARLKSADVGVVDVIVLKRTRGSDWVSVIEESGGAPTRTTDGAEYRLELVHAGEGRERTLNFLRESDGTRRMIYLAPVMFDLTHDTLPRAAFVDELDASMHPVLMRELVQGFNCAPIGNRLRGQLIFSAHETSLLDEEARSAVLRRDQVYFTRKDHLGASELYSLVEFKDGARTVHNIRKRYLQGRYGALPALGRFSE